MPLNPFVVALLEKMKGQPELTSGTPDDARALLGASRDAYGPGPALHRVEDRTVAGRSGYEIPVRVMLPSANPEGTIVYIHGGGWVIGTLDDFDTYGRALAERSNFAVVLVDYRLAPEHVFPAGLEDCEDVTAAVIAGRIEGAPARPLVVAGDSAGGNLATVVCRRAADRTAIALQVLIYPVTDFDFTRPSYGEFGKGMPLTGEGMRWFFLHYAPEAMWADPAIAPFHATDLAGMPATVVVTAECDVLRDEGEAYAGRLKAAGVPVATRRVEGVHHGFIRLHNLFDVADKEPSTLANDIRTHTLATVAS